MQKILFLPTILFTLALNTMLGQKIGIGDMIGKWKAESSYSLDKKRKEAVSSTMHNYSEYEFMGTGEVSFLFGTNNKRNEGTWTLNRDTIQIKTPDMNFPLVVKKLRRNRLQIYVIDGETIYGYDNFVKSK